VVKHSDVTVSTRCYIYEEKAAPVPGAGKQPDIAVLPDRTAERAKAEAARITENAENLARKILESARESAQKAREEAMREGYREGLAQGKREADKKIASALGELTELINGLEGKKASLLSEYEDRIKELSLELAKTIVNYELNIDNDVFVSMFKNAVREIDGSRWVKLMISENRSVFATAYADLLMSMVKDAEEIRISVLENAPDGTMLIETQQGFVDAGVDTQIKRFKAAFRNAGLPEGAQAGA
jgi:flagellar assembly protein FliH